MAAPTYPHEPQIVPLVETEWRSIRTPLPHPEALQLLNRLALHEARSMLGQPPIIWHRAHRFTVEDPHGNRWIDFSSGVLVANAGHGRQWIRAAMEEELGKGLHHSYCFPHQARLDLVEKLAEVAPPYLNKVFLLTTGSEAIECAIKIARRYGTDRHG
ncbi:MAG: aminotransferase class III-fold pyridoxal phosphate-dependent enzyme, partial [Candidatus Omnitrophica bacterium]|nr:aminotransferase class III-fold pyridoxal phosphate-dependent enzyme [Candidatus Omnitrophota bacterium]